MMGYGWDMGFGGWLWMLGGPILIIGIVVLVVWAIGGLNRAADRPTDGSSNPEPLHILRGRFARSEITEAEFEQAKRNPSVRQMTTRRVGWLGAGLVVVGLAHSSSLGRLSAGSPDTVPAR